MTDRHRQILESAQHEADKLAVNALEIGLSPEQAEKLRCALHEMVETGDSRPIEGINKGA